MQLSKRASVVSPSATLATGQRAQALQAQGIDVINLSVGQPDYATPQSIKDAAVTAIQADQVNGYTATEGVLPLRQAIAANLAALHGVRVDPSQVVVTTGAKMALYALFQVILNPGDEVLLPAPYWVSYSEQVKLAGGQPIEVAPTASLKVTPDQLASALTPATKAIVLNSPQNPSGTTYTRSELQTIGEFAVAHDLIVVADEIYGELLYDQTTAAPTMLGISPAIDDHTVLINGVSKTYAMTGWRIGYAVANATITGALKTVLSHMTGNPAAVSQAAATAALTGSQESVAQMKAGFKHRRDVIYPQLAALPGFKLTKPAGAFYFFPDVTRAMVLKGVTSTAEFVTQVLNEAHVATVTGEAFGLPGHIRLSYATDLDTLQTSVDRLKVFMNV